MIDDEYKLAMCIVLFMERFPDPYGIYSGFRPVVERAYARKSNKDMKVIARDLADWVEDLNVNKKNEFIEFARSQNIVYSSAAYEKNIAQLVRAGAINNEDDYRLLREYVERNHMTPFLMANVKKVNELIEKYEWELNDKVNRTSQP